MASAPRKGLNSARKIGSGPDNKGITDYTILTGYATSLGCGDPVKLDTDGTLIKATNGANAIGVLQGVSYKDSLGNPVFKQQWVGATAATAIVALVDDDPKSTFMAKADSPIPIALVGEIYPMTLSVPSSATGRSTALVTTGVLITGDVDLSAVTDLGAQVAGITDNDAFTIKTSQAGAATTITIVDGDGPDDLVDKLNAVANISAEIDGTTGFLEITATDGYKIVIAESVGTPYADLFAGAAGTFAATVAANAGMVKIISIPDVSNKVLEVVLVNHLLRDDG